MKTPHLETHLQTIDTLLEKRNQSYPWEFTYRSRINSAIRGTIGVLSRCIETPEEMAALVERVERI